jgi:hypothetical protein
MKQIRKLPNQKTRVETGPTQFGDDWPGLFVRGDDAFNIALQLENYMSGQRDAFTATTLHEFVRKLRTCITSHATNP